MLKWFLNKRNLKRRLKNESGQGMTEYIIIVALIAVAAIATMSFFGGTIKTKFSNIAGRIAGGGGATDAQVQSQANQARDAGQQSAATNTSFTP